MTKAERRVIRAAMLAYGMQINKTLGQLANMPKYHAAIVATHRACAALKRKGRGVR